MDQKQIFDLISEIGEEIIDEDTLRSIVISKEGVIAYDGFEPSGRIHIAQGVMRTINTNKINVPLRFLDQTAPVKIGDFTWVCMPAVSSRSTS